MIEITLIDSQQAMLIASTLIVAVAPLTIILVICKKLLCMFVSMVGGKIKL